MVGREMMTQLLKCIWESDHSSNRLRDDKTLRLIIYVVQIDISCSITAFGRHIRRFSG